MPTWRVALPHLVSESRPTPDQRTVVSIRGAVNAGGRFEVFYRRWIGPEVLPPWGAHTSRHPEWVREYRDPNCLGFASLMDARARAAELAAVLPNVDLTRYEQRDAEGSPVVVKEVMGRDPQLKALIMRHTDGRFEVRCFQYEVIASTEDGGWVEWDWARQRWDMGLFASDLNEAEAAAHAELEDLRG